MPDYHTFPSARTTEPDGASLFAQLRALDATVGIHQAGPPTWVLKKNTPWTAPQIAAAQNVLDTAPASTPQLTAQAAIDALPLVEKAIVFAIRDQFDLIRSKLAPPLPPITDAQMLAAIRTKAGQL